MAIRRPSLDELFRAVLPAEKLDQPCTDEHICRVALSVTDWKATAPFLGLVEPIQDEIEEDCRTSKDRKISMLRRWRQQFGKGATYRKLACVFWYLNRTDIVEQICDLLTDSLTDHTSLNSYTLYGDYLKSVYKSQLPVGAIQWPPLPKHTFINLAMIKPDVKVKHGTTDSEFVRLTIGGHVGDIMRTRVSIDLKDIFKLDKAQRKVILIEGAPGSGKSTLAWNMCQKWQLGQMFQQFHLIVLVQLRDPVIQLASSLTDILPCGANKLMAQDVSVKIIATCGKGVLFVMDGWDELPLPLQQDSFFRKLIQCPCDLSLHLSSVVVTSRPVSSADLHPLISSRVEIVGFMPEQVKQYFTQCLDNDPSTAQKLLDIIGLNPVIEGSCYLPLNAAIIAHLFLALDQTLPSTLHEILYKLVLCCLVRARRKDQPGKEQMKGISTYDSLPSDMQVPFENLCQLAFHGVTVNKVTFTSHEVTRLGLTPKIYNLGLLQAVQSFTSLDKHMTYNFLHLSIQEFLAAYHIATKMTATEQARRFQALIDQPRFSAVFQFYAGLTKLRSKEIKNVVTRMVKRGNEEFYPFDMSLLNCLYEAQDLSLCQFVASQLNRKLFIYTANPVDCLSVGYFLSCICRTTSGEFNANITGINDCNVKFLLKGLSHCELLMGSTSDDMCGHLILKLSDYKQYDTDTGFHAKATALIAEYIRTFATIKEIDLSGNEIQGVNTDKIQEGEDGLIHLAEALMTKTSLVSLTYSGYVSRDDCYMLKINEQNGPVITQMMCMNQTLRSLSLPSNDIDVVYIAEGLKHNSTIKILDLKYSSMSELGMKALSKALITNNSLEVLKISLSLFVGVDFLPYIARVIAHNTGLKQLYLCVEPRDYAFVTNQGMELLSGALEVNTTLLELYLDLCLTGYEHVTDKGIMALGECLKCNRGLRVLSFYRLPSDVTDKGWRHLVLCLQDNCHLTELRFYKEDNLCQRIRRFEETRIVNARRRQRHLPPLKVTDAGFPDL